MNSGYLRNEEDNSKCLLADGDSSGQVQVTSVTCEYGNEKQQWSYYESGEIVNQGNRCCMKSDGSTDSIGAKVVTGSCDNSLYTKWSFPVLYKDGDFLPIQSNVSSNCMDSDGSGNMALQQCDLLSAQRFWWMPGNWAYPDSKWIQVKCNMNGGINLQVENSVSYGQDLSEEKAASVAESIEVGCLFMSSTTTGSVSKSVADSWSASHSDTGTVSVSCDWYDDKTTFTGGCMWQLQLTTADVTNNPLEWTSSLITRCSNSSDPPLCPPFTVCADNACTGCVQEQSSMEEQVRRTHGEL